MTDIDVSRAAVERLATECRELGNAAHVTVGDSKYMRALWSAENTLTALLARAEAAEARADAAEQFLDNAISNSPQPLKDLGKWLSGLLDEDDWPTAERYLNAAAKSISEEKARADAMQRERNDADNALVDRYRDPKFGIFNFPTDVAAIVRRLDAAEAALAAERETVARLEEALRDAAEDIGGLGDDLAHFGELARHDLHTKAYRIGHEARAALTQKDRTDGE